MLYSQYFHFNKLNTKNADKKMYKADYNYQRDLKHPKRNRVVMNRGE